MHSIQRTVQYQILLNFPLLAAARHSHPERAQGSGACGALYGRVNGQHGGHLERMEIRILLSRGRGHGNKWQRRRPQGERLRVS